MKKVILILSIFLFGTIFIFGCTNSKVNESIVRIHIRANSNDEGDQNIKLKVRDRVVKYITPLIADCNDADDVKKILSENLNNITSVADEVLLGENYYYTSYAKITNEYFPTRNYSGITYSSGYYDALIINLGSGTGNNWWCVAYPPLCFVGEDNGSGNIMYRSKLIELINKYFGRSV